MSIWNQTVGRIPGVPDFDLSDALDRASGRDQLGAYQTPNQENFNLPNLGEQYGHYSGLQSYYRQRQAPQSRSFTSADSAFRSGQTDLGRMLMAQAQGRGPGQDVVRMQAQNMGNRAVAQQMAMANSGRPGMGSMGYRNAAMNAANAQSAVGGQAALGGLQAQLGATQQLGGFLQGARGQDLQRNMFNAQQQQQGSQFNTDAQLRQMGLNDQAQLEALRQRLQATGMQQQGGMGYENARTQRFQTLAGIPSGTQQGFGMIQGLLGAGVSAMSGGGAGAAGAAAGGGGAGSPTSPYYFNPYNY